MRRFPVDRLPTMARASHARARPLPGIDADLLLRHRLAVHVELVAHALSQHGFGDRIGGVVETLPFEADPVVKARARLIIGTSHVPLAYERGLITGVLKISRKKHQPVF